MKYLKVGVHELLALALILLAFLLRLLLISQNWPLLDSDEGTFGLMAMHIAYRGEHPIFLDGSRYMGALQSYIGAVLFLLFGGPSLFALRLGILLLVTAFLLSLYFLTRLLYSKELALIVLALLCFGSHYMLEYQIHSYGGYPEMLFFGTLLFLFASLLALFSRRERPSPSRQRWRLAAYFGWGLVAGLGFWSHMLILFPFVMSGLIILLFCWRELLRVFSLLCIIVGLLIGMAPLIAYNLHAAPGEDSLSVLRGLRQGGEKPLHYSREFVLKELRGTVQAGIPMITGNPFCMFSELYIVLREPNSPRTLQCTLVHSTWSGGYLLLFGLAGVVASREAWRAWRRWRVRRSEAEEVKEPEERRELVRTCARLCLLGSAALAIIAYATSSASVVWPANHARYMIGLWIALPAVIWPLWRGVRGAGLPVRRDGVQGSMWNRVWSRAWGRAWEIVRRWSGPAVLIGIGVVYLTGTIIVFGELPATRKEHGRDLALISYLERNGITRIYTEYWTCNKLAFLSNEKIICGVVDSGLRPTHNREAHYYDIVSADPRAAYVFPTWYRSPGLEQRLARMHYQRVTIDNYDIYQPLIT